ncbi:MAG TPA: ATP-binding protein [Actinomycetota bacterium]|nr:ATP-binding protein [Actinomycetota bacterium]
MAQSNVAMTSEAEPSMRGLWLGVLVFRWASFAFMSIAAVVRLNEFAEPEVAVAALVVTGTWNVWFSLTAGWRRRIDLVVDLAIAVALLPVSGIVMADGKVTEQLFFATQYPASVALTMGAATGVVGGLLAGLALSVGLVWSRVTNGYALGDLEGEHWGDIVNGAVYYLSAGGAAGVVRRALRTSTLERSRALEEASREHDRAVRLAERDALGREIHDSVLQALAMVVKRGKELTAQTSVASQDVGELVELAGRQEQALRKLLSELPGEPPAGMVSVRSALETVATGVHGVPVTVTAAGQSWVSAAMMGELSSAVHEALDNVVEHAGATRVTVYVESLDRELVISVRDDGIGFQYDEQRLAGEGKLGLLKSMKGRVEDLGGSMLVHTAAGRGTEIEFRLPIGEATS